MIEKSSNNKGQLCFGLPNYVLSVPTARHACTPLQCYLQTRQFRHYYFQKALYVLISVQQVRFYNLFNTTLLRRLDQPKVDRHPLQFTTPTYDVSDNSTRGNGEQTTSSSVNIRSRAHIVLIVSYMRSGSTLTGDIMQHFPGAFYVFEPFHSVVLRTRRGQSLMYTNGTTKQVT